MAVRVSTSAFEFAHGRAPRGRGGWAFEFVRAGARLENPEAAHHGGDLAFAWWAPGSLLFSEARRWAVARARELGATEVRVCS